MQAPERVVAKKCTVEDIQQGEFVKGEGYDPSYISSLFGKLSRVNILGAYISKNSDEAILDDGTGSITLRPFQQKEILDHAKPGDAVLCIGKVRDFNGVRYILPEIIKKIENPQWLQLRKIELQKREKQPVLQEKKAEEPVQQERPSNKQEILDKIKEADKGNGVFISHIVRGAKEEALLQELILEGEVFEIKPGTVKCLE